MSQCDVYVYYKKILIFRLVRQIKKKQNFTISKYSKSIRQVWRTCKSPQDTLYDISVRESLETRLTRTSRNAYNHINPLIYPNFRLLLVLTTLLVARRSLKRKWPRELLNI